ncbi:nicotinamide riboside kinase 2 [Sipha flava]|jgi:nicotinamide/nicotinate riboside kinase|uniref:Nicotinamide riboside kinase 2 n=1 Tax=Sipha flava TaxID=143950 RepID=A0A2S2R031_9HEMI|nr:nicotinamide riboside kinase 2 [Sipha flava]
MSKKLVVVITGVTCGGKTTISDHLKNAFDNISILHQDDFYYTDYDERLEKIPELNYHMWDTINAYNMNQMMTSIESQKSHILVLEGINLFDDTRILKLADLSFFIVMNKSDCLERRIARTYLPPEPAGYFEKYAWPEYEKYLTRIKEKEFNNIIFLNGSDSINYNVTVVVNHIHQQLLK